MLTDNLVGLFSPKAKFKRIQYRAATDALSKRKYEGASRGRRTSGWHTSSTSANTEIGTSIEILRNRSRDMVRNNPYANRGIAVIANNVVGKGIMPAIIAKTDALTERHRILWKAWADSLHIAYDCNLNFAGITQLIMRSVVESGEVLIRRRRVSPKDSPVPIQLQILEADHIVTNRFFNNSENGNRVIQGIEIDSQDCVVAYHLYENHPGSTGAEATDKANPLKVIRVPAADIIHVYRIDRPGQLRGIPWLAPSLLRLRDLCEFEDAELVKQKVAACFAAFIHDIEAPAETSPGNEDFDLEKLEPGIVEYLPPGKDIKFGTPPTPSADTYNSYISAVLHSVASGLGVSYESLTGDLSQVNFSSARMGWLEMQRNIEAWRSLILQPQFLDPMFTWFQEAAISIGEEMTGDIVTWSAPKREMIDPTKEVPAQIKAIRAGLTTLSDAVRQAGKHPESHFAELKKDNELIDKLGLFLDCDPRRTASTGLAQQSVEVKD